MTDVSWNPFWTGPREGSKWLEYCNRNPVSALTHAKAVGVTGHGMTFRLPTSPVLNPNGAVSGGVLAAALDFALGMTSMLPMPEDYLPNTTGLNVQYLRPAFAPLRFSVFVTRGGRSLVFVRADVYDRDDHLCATADGTFAVMAPNRVMARR